jgi:hypothetical protein
VHCKVGLIHQSVQCSKTLSCNTSCMACSAAAVAPARSSTMLPLQCTPACRRQAEGRFVTSRRTLVLRSRQSIYCVGCYNCSRAIDRLSWASDSFTYKTPCVMARTYSMSQMTNAKKITQPHSHSKACPRQLKSAADTTEHNKDAQQRHSQHRVMCL